VVDAPTFVGEPVPVDTVRAGDSSALATGTSPSHVSRRRFTRAAVIGIAVVTIPYLWVLWDLWIGSPNPLRVVDPSNFYDLQARGMFSGHLYVPNDALGIEAFVHAGHAFTYFGIFPSLIRMPILAVTHHFDTRLTAPSMFVAWLFTGLFSSLLVWRSRIMVRGDVAMGRAEATSFGVLIAAITGGSVVVAIAANPWVYNEDFAWSIALTTGSIFALLGMIERPSWRRVSLCGVLVLATSLNRTPAGYACIIGAFLVAAWFAFGRGGQENKRWTVPVALVGLVAFAANCLVTYAKFGIPIGLPMADQVWAHVNAHRRQFLAANGGKAFSVGFLPSTLTAYLNPAGLHLSGAFPYISLPTTPARTVGNAVLDQTYATSSIPTSMPLLFVLSIWGLVTTFRPRPLGRLGAMRLLVLTAAAAAAGVLVWGYIAESYLSDFMPFLIFASAIGMIDIWRRLEGRSTGVRSAVVAACAILGAFSVAANLAIASTPTPEFTAAQATHFVSEQNTFSSGALRSTVVRGEALPSYAPAGTLFIVGDCQGLYRSTGVDYANVPGQQIQHLTWAPIEQAAGINHTIDIKSSLPIGGLDHPVPLLTFGASTLVLEPYGSKDVRLRMENAGAGNINWPSPAGWPFVLTKATHRFFVMTDPNMHAIEVWWGSYFMIGHYLGGTGPAVVLSTHSAADGTRPPVMVSDVTPPKKSLPLCRSLARTP